MSARNRAVFLDRDGTLIRDADYLTAVEELQVLPGVPEALRRLKRAGFLLLLVTNQSAIARGWLTEERLQRIHERLNALLRADGAAIDGFYYCPHLPEGTVPRYAQECQCRKPQPGLLERAAQDWGVDLRQSYAVGDSERDVEAGRRAGCRTILVGTGEPTVADACVAHLAEAVSIILAADQESSPRKA